MTPIVLDPDTTSGRRTFKDLQDEVLAHGFDDTRYRTRVKAWLNEGLGRVVRATDLGEHEATQDFTTTTGDGEYPTNNDFRRVRSLRHVDNGLELDDVDIRELDRAGTASGKPSAYALLGSDLILYPSPDAAYSLQLRYWSGPAKMVNDGDVPGMPEDYVDLLISYALSKAFTAEDDFEAKAVHKADFDAGLRELHARRRRADSVRQIPGMYAVRGSRPRFTRPA